MVDQRIGVAVIGVGGVSLGNHLPGLALIPGVEIVALCDRSEEALAKAGALFNVRTLHRDPQAVIDDERVQAVVIPPPNPGHRGPAPAAVATGPPTRPTWTTGRPAWPISRTARPVCSKARSWPPPAATGPPATTGAR